MKKHKKSFLAKHHMAAVPEIEPEELKKLIADLTDINSRYISRDI